MAAVVRHIRKSLQVDSIFSVAVVGTVCASIMVVYQAALLLGMRHIFSGGFLGVFGKSCLTGLLAWVSTALIYASLRRLDSLAGNIKRVEDVHGLH